MNLADIKHPVFDGPPQGVDLIKRVYDLLGRIKFNYWDIRANSLGDGAYIQVALDEINPKTLQPWTGRKWYVSPHMTDAEIVATAFKACLTAVEHETREQFLFDGLAIFGPHLSLDALKANADQISARP